MAIPTLTNNSPVGGSIAWASFTIQYNGVGYVITSGSTSQRWVWWRYNAGSSIIEAGPDVPNDLSDDDLVLFGNKSGIGVRVQSATLIDGELLVDGSIFAAAVAANAIIASKIAAGAVTTDKMTANSIDGSIITAETLSASKITAGTITTDKMTANTIDGSVITGTTLHGDKIIGESITAGKLFANSVTSEKISAGAVTTDKMTANTINGSVITADTLDAVKIVTDSITALQIKADTITAAEIEAGTLTSASGIFGEIDASILTAGTIAAARIDASTIVITQSNVTGLITDLATAQTQANLAQQVAEAQGAMNLNPSFTDWSGVSPDNWSTFTTNPTKETALARTKPNAVRFNCTNSTTLRGIQALSGTVALPHVQYITVDIEAYLVSGASFAGSGLLLDWTGMTGVIRATLDLSVEIPNPVVGKWYRVSKVLMRPATAIGTQTSFTTWLMGQYSSGMGTMIVKDVIFNRCGLRPSTVEEILTYNSASVAVVTALASRGTDMVTNGAGTLGNNTNFSDFDFTSADAPTGAAGSFITRIPSSTEYADEFIAVDPMKKMQFSFQARQTGVSNTATMYAMLIPYDAYKLSIAPTNYMFIAGTTTTLAAPLNPGDTTVTLTNAANWYGSAGKPAGTSTHFRTIIYWDYVDAGGKAWPSETYSRNFSGYDYWADGSLVGNVITLRIPYAGVARSAGTPVSNGSSGGSYMYGGASNTTIPKTWTPYSATIIGLVTGGAGASFLGGWPPGVSYSKIGWLPNRQPGGPQDATSLHAIAAVSFSDASAANAAALAADVKAQAVTTAVVPLTTAYNNWKNPTDVTKIAGGSITTHSVSANVLMTSTLDATDITLGTGGVLKSSNFDANNGFQLSTTGLTIRGAGSSIDAAALTVGTIAAGRIAADTITAAMINTGAVTADAILAGAVTTASMTADSITGDRITINTLDATKIVTDSITALQIKADTITASEIKAGTLTSASGIFGALDASILTAGTIASDRINASLLVIGGSQINSPITNAAVTVPGAAITTAIPVGSVPALDATKITTGTFPIGVIIPAGQLSTGTIPITTIIQGGSITTGTIDASVVTVTNINATNISTGTIAAARIAAGTITAASGIIADLAVTTAKIADLAITTAKITDANITTAKINDLAVTSAKIQTLTADKIATGTLSAGVITISSSGQIKSADYNGTTTGWSLSNGGLVIKTGIISANALEAGSAVIGDLIIGRSADTLGAIKSYGYLANTTGFKLDKTGLEVNNGTITGGTVTGSSFLTAATGTPRIVIGPLAYDVDSPAISWDITGNGVDWNEPNIAVNPTTKNLSIQGQMGAFSFGSIHINGDGSIGITSYDNVGNPYVVASNAPVTAPNIGVKGDWIGPGTTIDCYNADTVVLSVTAPIVVGQRYKVTGYAHGSQFTTGGGASYFTVQNDQAGGSQYIVYSAPTAVGYTLIGTSVMYMIASSTRTATFYIKGRAGVGFLRTTVNTCHLTVEAC